MLAERATYDGSREREFKMLCCRFEGGGRGHESRQFVSWKRQGSLFLPRTLQKDLRLGEF